MKFISEENKKKVNELLNNFYIHDCCILSDKYFCMIAEEYLDEDDDDYEEGDSGPIKQVCYNMRNAEIPPRWTSAYWQNKNSFYRPKLINTERDEVLIISDTGLVYYMGLGQNKQYEERIPTAIAPGVASLKRIDDEVYLVAHRRTVTKREGVSRWKSLTADDMWNDELSPLHAGFEDIDGFSSDDLYAVGRHSDVWRYDGQDWIPLDVGDINAHTVCCADDGYVYIAGTWGVVIRGREDEWETYLPEDLASKTWYAGADSGFSSSVSYQGRVYLGGESIGTYFIDLNSNNKKPQQYDFNGEIEPFSARFMSVGYGMMMFANQHRAALHDGEKWIDLYGGSQ